MASTVDSKRIAEYREDDDTFEQKMMQLADMVRQSKYTVFFTGAGMSTSAGVGDYRGPSGAWTQRRINELKRSDNPADRQELKKLLDEQEKEQAKASKKVPMTDAQPTMSHMMQSTLIHCGLAHFVVTTNLDGIYRKSGLQAHEQVCFLHGDVYTERCTGCGYDFERNWHVRQGDRTHVHDHSVGVCSRCGSAPPKKYTGRPKAKAKTGSDSDGFRENHLVGTRDKDMGTKDTHINFGELLDEVDWNEADSHCGRADLCIVMGTSMSLRHITHFPFKAARSVIVNLQQTPDDRKCDLRVWAKCDEVSAALLTHLGLEPMPAPIWRPRDALPLDQVPNYVRREYREAARRLQQLITTREKENERPNFSRDISGDEFSPEEDPLQAGPRRRCPSRSMERGRAADARHRATTPRRQPAATTMVEPNPEPAAELIGDSALQILVGNTHSVGAGGRHRWKLYITGRDVSRLRAVEIWLHPTFKQNHFVLDTPPFELACNGWGTFCIRIRVHKISGGHADLKWPLQFDEDDAHMEHSI